MYTLYNLKDKQGAYRFIDIRDTEAGVVADVQLIGAGLPISADPADLTTYAGEAVTFPDKLTTLAQRAAVIYKLDPARIDRACNIVRAENPSMIQEHSAYLLITGSKDKKYQVTKGSCECADHKKGNVCKHRIAANFYREIHPEQTTTKYYARRYCIECLVEHWVELTRYSGELCKGETFDPFHIPHTFTTHSGQGVISVNTISYAPRAAATMPAAREASKV